MKFCVANRYKVTDSQYERFKYKVMYYMDIYDVPDSIKEQVRFSREQLMGGVEASKTIGGSNGIVTFFMSTEVERELTAESIDVLACVEVVKLMVLLNLSKVPAAPKR